MSNLTPINDRHPKTNTRTSGRAPYKSLLLVGMFMALMVPEIIYCVYDGPVRPEVFAFCNAFGFLWGLARYKQPPKPLISCVPKVPAAQVFNLRKAA